MELERLVLGTLFGLGVFCHDWFKGEVPSLSVSAGSFCLGLVVFVLGIILNGFSLDEFLRYSYIPSIASSMFIFGSCALTHNLYKRMNDNVGET